MKYKLINIGITVCLTILTNATYGQKSEIVELSEPKTYEYLSYHSNGQIKQQIGFYSKKPYKTVREFEVQLNKYKIKEHGDKKEFYANGQLKQIVVYKKGKVIEFAKNYFEDGEEFTTVTDELPVFQFSSEEQYLWFAQRIKEVENKYGINLEGSGFVALEINKDGIIKSIEIPSKFAENEKYLLEIGEQIKVVKPAFKDGKAIGTKFGFIIQL